MTTHYKPDGYASVAPYLLVKGADATVQFLVDVFGAKELRRYTGEDGRVRHAEVRIDNSPVNPIPFMRSTDYLMAMKRAGNAPSMDQVALGGPGRK